MASHKEGEEEKIENPFFTACGREGGRAQQ
jgi:hypothetical protein